MLNVARMQMLGAEVIADGGLGAQGCDQRGLRLGDQRGDHQLSFGTAAGPHPSWSWCVTFSVIGDEARPAARLRGRLPDVVAWGGGSNAIGSLPRSTIPASSCSVAAAGDGFGDWRHASITADEVGVLHGARTFVLQERDGQTKGPTPFPPAYHPGVGPQHAWLARRGAPYYAYFRTPRPWMLSAPVAHGGHHSAIESPCLRVCAPARAKAEAEGPFAPGEEPIAIVTVSGRGDKDVDTASGIGTVTRSCRSSTPARGPSRLPS